MFTIAQISDTHFGHRPEARPRVERVLDHLLSMTPRPDLLLVTGDVADHGLPQEYVEAREVFARWPGPLLIGTGNHDVRDAFATGLLDRESDGPLDQVLELGGLRFLMLDSLVSAPPGERIDHGVLSPQTLGWLDEQLAASPLPAFVCLHHSPVSVNIALMDDIQLREPEALAQILARHPQVVAVLVGHNHSACVSIFADRPMLIAGGVVSTVTLDAEPQAPIWEDAPPTFAFHLVDDAGRLTTHWRSV